MRKRIKVERVKPGPVTGKNLGPADALMRKRLARSERQALKLRQCGMFEGMERPGKN